MTDDVESKLFRECTIEMGRGRGRGGVGLGKTRGMRRGGGLGIILKHCIE